MPLNVIIIIVVVIIIIIIIIIIIMPLGLWERKPSVLSVS